MEYFWISANHSLTTLHLGGIDFQSDNLTKGIANFLSTNKNNNNNDDEDNHDDTAVVNVTAGASIQHLTITDYTFYRRYISISSHLILAKILNHCNCDRYHPKSLT